MMRSQGILGLKVRGLKNTVFLLNNVSGLSSDYPEHDIRRRPGLHKAAQHTVVGRQRQLRWDYSPGT